MKKIIFIVAFCSFLLFMLAGWRLTLWMGERDQKAASSEWSYASKTEPKILENTRIVYQYFYTKDRVTKELVETAPVFLQGLNMEQLKSIYQGWQIILFSPEKVIIQCTVDGFSSETYILGEMDGFLAVFYEDEQKKIHLREKTEVPLNSLPEEEVKQIREGRKIVGEENLVKALADLTS